ncbi:MAG: molybdenum ABC transporter ATP-binding protein [Spirochaetia bacterium]|nr:molybdenum ABC transporter ATP-binding protein [Spirochaetia bacterium]
MISDIEIHFKLNFHDFNLDVSFNAPSKGVTAVFGPSGSGKTTLLRCMAGLEHSNEGLLCVNGQIWQNHNIFIPVNRRPLGFVFQEASLFSHLSVKKNLTYGFKRIQPSERIIKIEQIIELLGLNHIINRKETMSLSGGEKQRVAIGRALLTSPRILLMDEPLTGLDVKSKYEILPYLERLHKELEIPVFYVSHALDEVTRLADYIVILDKGRVTASGNLNETLTRLDLPTARLDEAGAVIEAFVAVYDETYSLTRLDFSGGSLWASKIDRVIGAKVRARILARDVSIAAIKPQATSITNVISAQICEIQDLGPDRTSLRLEIGDYNHKQVIMSRITRRSRDQLGLAVGMQVYAQVKSVALII